MQLNNDTSAVMAEKQRKEKMRLELLRTRRELDECKSLLDVQNDEITRLRDSRNALAVELTEVKHRLGMMQFRQGVRR